MSDDIVRSGGGSPRGEMTPAQQREWERTLNRQMKRKSLKDGVSMRDLQKPGNVEKLKKLKIQIEKLSAIGGLDSIVPSEGIVFKYKGKIYKFTGAFAPINQILGSLKFG